MKPNIGQGDKGKTHLPGGKEENDKVWKDSPQVEAYGELDELNSLVGFLHAQEKILPDDANTLREIQDYIFRAELHVSAQGTKLEDSTVPVFGKGAVDALEKKIEKLEKNLSEIKHFILPGGTQEAALADMVRTKSRSVERRVVAWIKTVEKPTPTQEAVLAYVNRLSDYFFALSRILNQRAGKTPPPWKGREKTK